MVHTVKNLPAVCETWVQSLGWEDALEKGKTTHSSILAWRIPSTEEPGELQSMGSQSQTRLSNLAHMDNLTMLWLLGWFLIVVPLII